VCYERNRNYWAS